MRSVRSQSGQSLIAALVSIAITGIAVVVMASIFSMQNRESQALSERLSALDLQRTLTTALADGSVCKYVMNNPAVVNFDSTKPMSPTQPLVIYLPSSAKNPATLYLSVTPGPPLVLGPVVAQVNQPASLLSNSVVVSSISLQLTGGSAGNYMGNWVVNFDSGKLVRPIKPVSVTTTITADISNPTAAIVKSCQGSGAGPSSGSGQWCGAFTTGGGPWGAGSPYTTVAPCAGYTPPAMVCNPVCWNPAGPCPSGYKPVQISFTPDAGGGNPSATWTCISQ